MTSAEQENTAQTARDLFGLAPEAAPDARMLQLANEHKGARTWSQLKSAMEAVRALRAALRGR